jgi:hypothetical protein
MNERKEQRTSRIQKDFWFADPTLVIADHLANLFSISESARWKPLFPLISAF